MKNRKISIIGLGYVGLPVAVSFGRNEKTIGFDINNKRIDELKEGYDKTLEVTAEELEKADILFTSREEDLVEADFHIIAVPTPVDDSKKPDLTPMIRASEMIGRVLKAEDIVVYESTVYPGATEEVCIPVLERISGLKGGVDFKVGYSPERINPGDKEHRFTNIIKVVSAQDPETLEIVAQVYESVVVAGVHRASCIKVAEAAKVIENTQRDLNIALMNELALIFDKLEIDTNEVLAAAGTKWNFLNFKPGLVGGHCIGVDPYYLTHKAEKEGYHPQVILAGRLINDGMGKFIAQKTIKEMIRAKHIIFGGIITVLGLTFKENCPDLRNSKVIDIIIELKEFGVKVQISDYEADFGMARDEYNIEITPFEKLKPAGAIIVAVAHKKYCNLSLNSFKQISKPNPVIMDVKGVLDRNIFEKAGFRVLRL
jgi:UDP-N-acetyl-D-glucosamine/UDP-N-acetyl-D-galactosamine dehydrogenase